MVRSRKRKRRLARRLLSLAAGPLDSSGGLGQRWAWLGKTGTREGGRDRLGDQPRDKDRELEKRGKCQRKR